MSSQNFSYQSDVTMTLFAPKEKTHCEHGHHYIHKTQQGQDFSWEYVLSVDSVKQSSTV